MLTERHPGPLDDIADKAGSMCETNQEVFACKVLANRGLLSGRRIGIDATTLEANAAMRSIVQLETGESYEESLRRRTKA